MNRRIYATVLVSAFFATSALSQESPQPQPNLKLAAREAFANAEPGKAHQHLQALVELHRQRLISSEKPDGYAFSQGMAEVAREYLRAAELRKALTILGEAADLNLPYEEGQDDGLGTAAAGLHRQLAGLDAQERFELLREWSMPTESRRAVRVLTTITPMEAPPSVFARVLGERPRDDSFALAKIGEVRGLFCSAWELVRAANESASLRRLTSELSQLVDDHVPNARFVFVLAQIVASDRADDPLLAELQEHAAALKGQTSHSLFATLPLEQQVWEFGYGQFDINAKRVVAFKNFPHWDGSTWRGGATYPDPEVGWTALRTAGGHPGRDFAAIRRWVAPADGTLSFSGTLRRDATDGNGICGRLVSSRSGVLAEWDLPTGSVATRGEAIEVERGSTLDFMVESIDARTHQDSFAWTVQLVLQTKRGEQLTFDSAKGFHGPARSIADVVIAAACLTQKGLRPIGEDILQTKLEQTYDAESLRMRPFLRYAIVRAIQQRDEHASFDLFTQSNLPLWLPSSTKRAWPNPQGSVRPLWLSDREHILHAFGPRNDYLLFKYPLTGEFEFSCETQIGGPGGTDGCVAYGGLGYEVWAARSLAKIWDTSFHKLTEFHCPFVGSGPIPSFNRFAIKSTTSEVTFLANGHPTWVDTWREGTSPWIGIRSFGERVPIFRHLEIDGAAVIPREVKMSAGNSLRGWAADYYDESTPAPTPRQAAGGFQTLLERMLSSYDWSASGGVIHGARRFGSNDAVSQSRLYYLRPLQNGESISYEFEYKPGEIEVHPTLGRLALLIEPDGIRLHWMTDGDQEWTGLAEDNAVVEPLNRRGPKPLPLMDGEWNRVTIELERETLTLSLNDETIYIRKMEPENDRTFGFYHDKNRSAVRVRNIVMQGDWPERLTREQLASLTSGSELISSDSYRRVVGAILDDAYVHGSAIGVHQRALALPAEERFAYLARWVLPSTDHRTLRLALDFTPTNPAPPASDAKLTSHAEHSRVTAGGELVAPALDLIAVAKQLGRLDEIRKRVAALSLAGNQQQRSQHTMLALIDIADGDLASASQKLDELASMVAASTGYSFRERWPETLAIWQAARFAETREAVRDMALQINIGQVRKRISSGYEAWDQQMRGLLGRVLYFDLLDREPSLRDPDASHLGGQLPLANWAPTSHETARTRGRGFPQAHWALSAPATLELFASHHDDYLFYRIPLRGNFEVECDVSAFGYRETNLWVAGRWVGPVYTYREVDVGTFRAVQRLPLDPPIHKPDEWIRYRAVVHDGVCTTYANGLKIHERRLETEHDPWLAIRSYDTTNGAVRNLRITGKPVIPTEVRLTANDDLPGWLPINEGHRIGRNLKWQQLGDLANGGGIRGARWESLPGSHWETLIRYHRPMVEDGTIEYDFYYRDGETHVHPALDRLAFMLDPEGVRVHWVTDEQFDRTDLAPDNVFNEPANRRGPNTLPLKPDDWNRLQLSLTGDTVALALNGELIYERELEPTNQRTFGLFHYADRTVALVRNIVWRGNWPRELPSIKEQELAGEGVDFLDESLDELAAGFHHNFAEDGLMMERFGLNVGELTNFDAHPDGLRVTRPGGNHYHDSAIVPRLTIGGDFDIVAEFDHFAPDPSAGGSSGVFLQAILDNDKSNEFLIYRRHLRHHAVPQPIIQASFVGRESGGARRSHFPAYVGESTAGRLRLARRGDTVYHLFAENDSPHFRLLGRSSTTRDDLRVLKLMTQTHLEGMTTVVWKRLTIRANRLSGLAIGDRDELLAQLNSDRDALADHFVHDFTTDPLSENRFQQWGPAQPRRENGVRMTSIGTDRWTSSGFNSLLGLQGDFDAEITFAELDLARPKDTLNSSFYLQVEFPDAARTQANILLVDHVSGDREVYAQIRVVDGEGNNEYRRLRTAPVNEVEKLRMVRQGKRFYFLYRRSGADHDEVLAETDISDLPVRPGNLRWLLHTGGDSRQSEVLLKKLEVRGARIAPNPALMTESPSLLNSILDLFK